MQVPACCVACRRGGWSLIAPLRMRCQQRLQEPLLLNAAWALGGLDLRWQPIATTIEVLSASAVRHSLLAYVPSLMGFVPSWAPMRTLTTIRCVPSAEPRAPDAPRAVRGARMGAAQQPRSPVPATWNSRYFLSHWPPRKCCAGELPALVFASAHSPRASCSLPTLQAQATCAASTIRYRRRWQWQ